MASNPDRSEPIKWSKESVLSFFGTSDLLDRLVLRPLAHIAPNWELTQSADQGVYIEEDDSLAGILNELIQEISTLSPPRDYHEYENSRAKLYDQIEKKGLYLSGKLWRKKSDGKPISKDALGYMIEQASIGYEDVPELVLAASGRVASALHFGNANFDDLDSGHMGMLAEILLVIMFIRSDARQFEQDSG